MIVSALQGFNRFVNHSACIWMTAVGLKTFGIFLWKEIRKASSKAEKSARPDFRSFGFKQKLPNFQSTCSKQR
jgi:hypothetical protein